MQGILTKSQIEKCKKILKNRSIVCRKTKDYLSCIEAEEIKNVLKNLNNLTSHNIHLIKNIIEKESEAKPIIRILNKNFKDPWVKIFCIKGFL